MNIEFIKYIIYFSEKTIVKDNVPQIKLQIIIN